MDGVKGYDMTDPGIMTEWGVSVALWLQKETPALTHAVSTHTTYKCHPPPPPLCTSRSGVTLICQEAEGGQIYNDSREQHQVTAVNIYTGLTKDVAKVCGGSEHCRNCK